MLDYYDAKIEGMCELAGSVGDLLIANHNIVGFITDVVSKTKGGACATSNVDNAKGIDWLNDKHI